MISDKSTTGLEKYTHSRHRTRIALVSILIFLAGASIFARLAYIATLSSDQATHNQTKPAITLSKKRPDILADKGEVIATSLPTLSLFANPSRIQNAEDIATGLSQITRQDKKDLLRRLTLPRQFIWLKRQMTPSQIGPIKKFIKENRLEKQLDFREEWKRTYPMGETTAHLVGLVDIDGKGLSGIERWIDETDQKTVESVQTSINIRLQHAAHSALGEAIEKFNAIGGSAIIMSVERPGEIMSAVSLPTYDPDMRNSAAFYENRFNRFSQALYEPGSTFKLINAAIGIETGLATPQTLFDVTKPFKIGPHRIRDYKPKGHSLSLHDIVVTSSNVGSAMLAMDITAAEQKKWIEQMGGIQRYSHFEVPEVETPRFDGRWGKIHAATISFGHGISVTPLHIASMIATVAGHGLVAPPRLTRTHESSNQDYHEMISADTRKKIRSMMIDTVEVGTGSKAQMPGYLIGGKTGTAEKPHKGRYDEKKLISSFVGIFPADNPQIIVYVMVDEPKGRKDTHNYATGGWVAAPVVKNIASSYANMIGMAPTRD